MDAKTLIIETIASATKLPNHEIAAILEVPKVPELGDFALPCFRLAAKMKKDPKLIAKDIAAHIKFPKDSAIKEAKVVGPYVNFFLNKTNLAESVLTEVFKVKDSFGAGTKKKEKVMVEFSNPNTHKTFHMGHVRGTPLGDSLVKILKFSGYPVIAANYIGDIGTHVAKVMWYMQKYHSLHEHQNQKNKGEWLGKLYVEATKKVKDHPQNEKEVAETLQRLESGKDKELTNLWKITRIWSLQEFKRIYEELGVKFDEWFFESEVESAGKKIALELLKEKIARKDQGALLVDLSEYDLDVFLILKSDGTALYGTKDLALAKVKFEKYDVDKSIYVTSTEQIFYFKQLFKTLELMGFPKAKNCYHLAYETVNTPEGKMSSRTGEVVLYTELIAKLKSKALEEIKKRNPKLRKTEEIAEKIALAALKYGMLKQASNKVIVFDLEKALEFQGDTGPYLQYSLVRAKKILEKVGKPSAKVDFNLLKADEEVALLKEILAFKEIVAKAAEQYAPYLIANYAFELTQAFNAFYEKCPVAQADKKAKEARTLLVWAFAQTLKNALNLLGIEEVSVM
jgi:arginyl-tRNA synthetase